MKILINYQSTKTRAWILLTSGIPLFISYFFLACKKMFPILQEIDLEIKISNLCLTLIFIFCVLLINYQDYQEFKRKCKCLDQINKKIDQE